MVVWVTVILSAPLLGSIVLYAAGPTCAFAPITQKVTSLAQCDWGRSCRMARYGFAGAPLPMDERRPTAVTDSRHNDSACVSERVRDRVAPDAPHAHYPSFWINVVSLGPTCSRWLRHLRAVAMSPPRISTINAFVSGAALPLPFLRGRTPSTPSVSCSPKRVVESEPTHSQLATSQAGGQVCRGLVRREERLDSNFMQRHIPRRAE